MFSLPVIVCIGTPKVSGDSLGPMVGDILKERKTRAFVYGDCTRSVTALNFQDYCRFILRTHPCSLIIAVDAGLSSVDEVGAVKMNTGGVSPGGALAKKLGKIGNIGVLGIVGEAGDQNMDTLLNVKRDFVYDLAKKVADRIGAIIERSQVLQAL